MSKKKWVMFLIGAAVLLLLFYPTSDEKILRRLVSEFELDANRIAALQPLERVLVVNRKVAYFSDPSVFQLDDNGEQSSFTLKRDELKQRGLAAAQKSFQQLEVKFRGLQVVVAGESATVEFDLHVLGALNEIDGQFYENWRVKAVFGKLKGQWLIQTIDAKNLRQRDVPESIASAR